MKTYRAVEELYTFFISASDGYIVSFTLRPLYPQRKEHYTHCICGYMGLRVSIDAVEKRKIFYSC
jgi:hypothetical protein